MKYFKYELIVGGARSGKTRLLKEKIEKFQKNGGENVLFVCPTGTIRYLGLEKDFYITTPDYMKIPDCKCKTAVEVPRIPGHQYQRDIALFIANYCNYSVGECDKATLIIVDETPNILGTEMINLLANTPICNQIVFTMQSPLQLQQLEEESDLSLDREFSTFCRWSINKIGDQQYAYFKQQSNGGWKMAFPECFPQPVEVKKRGRKPNIASVTESKASIQKWQ